MSYKTKYYKCELQEIKQGIKDTKFILLNTETNEIMTVDVDQLRSVIEERMEEVKNKKRDKLYLTHGMRDIDLSFTRENKWQIFDEFDIYEFE